MRITVAYNLRTDTSEETAELLTEADVDRICSALRQLRHKVTPVEVTGQPDDVVERLLDSDPDLIFNVAEGTIGTSREAFYPGLYEQLRIPFTGGNPSLLHMNLDKHLAKTVVAARGIRVPRGGLVTPRRRDLPAGIEFPLMVKPNAEGSSKGVTQDSVVETPEAFEALADKLLARYPAGSGGGGVHPGPGAERSAPGGLSGQDPRGRRAHLRPRRGRRQVQHLRLRHEAGRRAGPGRRCGLPRRPHARRARAGRGDGASRLRGHALSGSRVAWTSASTTTGTPTSSSSTPCPACTRRRRW